MVGCRGEGADAVVSCWEAAGHSGGEKTFTIASIVDTLEESELGGIESGGGVQAAAEILNGHVSVPDDQATRQLLRCGVVGCVCVGERTGHEVGHLHSNVEGGVGCDSLSSSGWEGDDGGDHGSLGWDVSHCWA